MSVAPHTVPLVSAHIEADPTRVPCLAEVATALGCSPRTLQRRLAMEGSSYGQVQHHARMRRAALLLARGASTQAGEVAKAGHRCGYRSASHFSQAFRAFAGKSPGEWLMLARVIIQHLGIHRSGLRHPITGQAPGARGVPDELTLGFSAFYPDARPILHSALSEATDWVMSVVAQGTGLTDAVVRKQLADEWLLESSTA